MIVTSRLIEKLKGLAQTKSASKEVSHTSGTPDLAEPELGLLEPGALALSPLEPPLINASVVPSDSQEEPRYTASEQSSPLDKPPAKAGFLTMLGAAFKRVPTVEKLPVKSTGVPIRLIIGYFPGITEREAKEYAKGLAQKHCDQLSISYTGAFKHANGYAFEIQEGGGGKAFTPEVLKYFDSLGPYTAGENHYVVLKTATRLVEVVRLQDGLGTVILPEGAKKDVTDWLKPSKSLKNAQPSQAKFFYATSLLFASGVVACILSGAVFRLQPYSAEAAVKKEIVSASKLPRSQWAVLSATPRGFYVKTLRFSEGRWLPPELAAEEPSNQPVKSSSELEKK